MVSRRDQPPGPQAGAEVVRVSPHTRDAAQVGDDFAKIRIRLAQRFGVSRPVVYQWIHRYREGGAGALASLYRASPRRMPAELPAPEYPGHFEGRYLSKDGNVHFTSRQFFVSQALAPEYGGFEEIDDGVWSCSFYDRLLARLDERDFKLGA